MYTIQLTLTFYMMQSDVAFEKQPNMQKKIISPIGDNTNTI